MTSALPTQLPNSALAISTRGLGKRYGSKIALHNVALQVPEGAVYVLVGANGAGKSTIFNVLLDLLRADTGTADVLGLNVRKHGPQVRANVGYVPEQPSWGYGQMRVQELLQHHARYYPAWEDAYALQLTRVLRLRVDQRMDALSKGQARRVHLTLALAHRPPLLILDEPTDGLDPLIRDEAIGILVDHLAESPTTVLIATHHVDEMDQLADHIGILNDGELRTQLPLHVLRNSLHRYRVSIPEGWAGIPTLDRDILRRSTKGREMQLTIWGSPSEVSEKLTMANAVVRDATQLSLREAAVALLVPPGEDRP